MKEDNGFIHYVFLKVFIYKYTSFEVGLANHGWHWWDWEYRHNKKCSHAGIDIWLEILGWAFCFTCVDTRHWNKQENRFYFDEEPELWWLGENYTPEQYWAAIDRTIKAHPELDVGYYGRCQKAFKTYQAQQIQDSAQEDENDDDTLFVPKRPIAWDNIGKVVDSDGKHYKLEKINDTEVKLIGLRRWRRCPLDSVLGFVNIYDKQGNLMSSLEDYE